MHNPFFDNKGPFEIDHLLQITNIDNKIKFPNIKIHDIKDLNTATNDDVTFTVESFPNATVTNTNVTCYGLDNGSITFTFPDYPGRVNIAFSLDGGLTYKPSISDTSGSITYSNLAPGVYDVWAEWGNGDYPTDLGSDITITEPAEIIANNTTSSANISEGQTKTLIGDPSGGSWSIVSGGGSISNSTYTPDDINTDTTVKIKYTIAANGTCAATSDNVTFTVTPICPATALSSA